MHSNIKIWMYTCHSAWYVESRPFVNKTVCVLKQWICQLLYLKCIKSEVGAGIAHWYRTGVQAGWSGVWFPTGAWNFSVHHRVHNGSGSQGLFSWGWSGCGMKLTTHLHLVQRSRLRGAIPPLPLYVFMA